jgi:hypothetical protein
MQNCPRHLIRYAAALVWLGAALAANADLFNTNLIVNGDAESGPGSGNGGFVNSIPGWAITDITMCAVVQYGASGGFPLPTDPGPANRGANFFAGGPTVGYSALSQTVDVSAATAAVDSSNVLCVLSAWLGGYTSQDDHASLTAWFLDATGTATLGTATIGPVLAVDRGSVTGLIFKQATNTVPGGTRSIRIQLQMIFSTGAYNDGYADNLSLVFTIAPTLNILPSPNGLTLLWPTNSGAWHLQSTTNIPGGWADFVPSTLIQGTNNAASITLTNSSQFFRLKFP